MSDKGLSVVIRNEHQFNRIKSFLGEDCLYLNYVPQMAEVETGIVIHYYDEDDERAYRFEIRAREESRRMMLEETATIRTELKESLYVKGSIKLKPKWWMRVKMFFQGLYYLNEDFIPFTVSILTAISIFIILTIKSILLK